MISNKISVFHSQTFVGGGFAAYTVTCYF